MLEMGEPVSILDLAQRMIRLSGLHPGTDIQIRIIGPRVGEKLHEQLHSPSERLVTTEHPSILASRTVRFGTREDSERLEIGLEELVVAATDRNEVRSRRVLFDMVAEGGPDATHQEKHGGRRSTPQRIGGPLPASMAIEDEIPA